jgi:phage tail sheath protein FI
MASAYTYPGVYIQEAAGIGSIVGVSTSDTVFIDFFAQGPVGVATEISSMDEFNRTFGGLDQRSEASYGIQQFFLNGGTTAWVVRVIDTTSGAATQSTSATYSIPFGTAPTLTATASSPGAWGSNIQIAFDNQPSGAPTSATSPFNMVVRQVATQNGSPVLVAREVYRGLSSDPTSSQYIVSVVNNVSSIIALSGSPLTAGHLPTAGMNTGVDVITNTTGATIPKTVTIAFLTSATSGSDGVNPGTAGTAWGTTVGPSTLISGLNALDSMAPYTFSLICIPAAAELSTSTQIATVYAAALVKCQTYMAFLLIDTPAYPDPGTFMKNWYANTDFEGLFSDHAAVYYPRLQVPDPLNSYSMRPVAASGTVAGIYARTDANRGIWKAPAGTEANLKNATVDVNLAKLPINLSDSDNGALNPFGINAIRNFPIYGTVVWGARTLNGADAMASQWKYTPVRRLALYIEQSLFQGSKWIVFEPNDEPLWGEIRKTFTAFMQSLFLQGAFQGSSPNDAYFVRCDGSTTTQNDINGGVVNILVGFAPLKPAEFVVITIQQMAGQAGT